MGIDRFSGVSLLEEIEKFNQSKSEQELLDPTLRSWISIDRLRLKPFFTAEDINQEQSLKSLPGQFPFTRGYKVSNNDWVIQEVIKTEDLAEANLKGLDALDKGAESLAFRAKQFSSVDDFAILLDGIDETKVELSFNTAKNTSFVAKLFISHLELKGIDRDKVKVSFDFDPLSCLIKSGHFNDTKANDFYEVYELMQLFDEQLPLGKCVTINTQNIHNSGATAVQEVAFGLAMVNEYMNHLVAKGVSIDKIVQRIKFNWAVSANLNLEVAKLRAIRSLWATMIKQYDPREKSSYEMDVHCISAESNKSLYTPQMNIVRATNEALGAVIGGCNSLALATYDSVYRDSDNFSESISRNVQLLLKGESNISKVIDPMAGSYYIENLTNQIAYRSWKLLQEVESNGGFVTSMKSGLIKAEIDAIVDVRNMHFSNRDHLIVGTNHFAVSQEQQLLDVDIDIYTSVQTQANSEELTPPLTPYRGAKYFESLRLKSEQYALAKGSTPKVYLLQMGMVNKLSSYAYNLFVCGGYEVRRSPIHRDVEKAIQDAKNDQPDIIVICGDYSKIQDFDQIIEGLVNHASILMAAQPSAEHKKAFKEKGVVTFLHEETDVINVLKYFHKQLGIM